MELTEVQFWDDYWVNCKLPSVVDQNLSFECCPAQALKENLPAMNEEVLEVGRAPEEWLESMSTEFGLKPNGIENSKAGRKRFPWFDSVNNHLFSSYL